MMLYGLLRSESHRAAPLTMANVVGSVSNSIVFQWTEEVNPPAIFTDAETEELLYPQYQLWSRYDYNHRDNIPPGTVQTVEIAFGM